MKEQLHMNHLYQTSIHLHSTSSITLEINKPVIDKQDYAELKKFFENMYSQLNNQILLRKKDD